MSHLSLSLKLFLSIVDHRHCLTGLFPLLILIHYMSHTINILAYVFMANDVWYHFLCFGNKKITMDDDVRHEKYPIIKWTIMMDFYKMPFTILTNIYDAILVMSMFSTTWSTTSSNSQESLFNSFIRSIANCQIGTQTTLVGFFG